MPSIEVVVTHEVGLHARPAAAFVKTAASYPCEIKVTNLTAGSPAVNAKSILGVLSIGVHQDNTIVSYQCGRFDNWIDLAKGLKISEYRQRTVVKG